MIALHRRTPVFILLALTFACTSATDRLNEGMGLQAQGRYMEAVYRYADALDRDPELTEARERLIAVGDTAMAVAMDQADDLERRGDPVQAARRYREVDQMLSAVRQVGVRLVPPADYGQIRRAVYDNAIGWQMVRGDEAREEGRWADAREYYVGARADFLLPARIQVEESYDAETNVLLNWSEIELTDGRALAAHELAQEALAVRSSPARDVVLQVRELQSRALDVGTVVVAIPPAQATGSVREYLGPEFEIALDDVLYREHWSQPPLFVDVADPLILRSELRGLLRGQVAQSPMIVGRALGMIGADLAVLIELTRVDVVEEDVEIEEHEAIIPVQTARSLGVLPRRTDSDGTAMDTVTYRTIEGDLSYFMEAVVALVDADGREIDRFVASADQAGPFTRGEFDGNPSVLPLSRDHEPFFEPAVLAEQVGQIESALLRDLSVAIATGTYDTVLSGLR